MGSYFSAYNNKKHQADPNKIWVQSVNDGGWLDVRNFVKMEMKRNIETRDGQIIQITWILIIYHTDYTLFLTYFNQQDIQDKMDKINNLIAVRRSLEQEGQPQEGQPQADQPQEGQIREISKPGESDS